jgi:hypothetical protein
MSLTSQTLLPARVSFQKHGKIEVERAPGRCSIVQFLFSWQMV